METNIPSNSPRNHHNQQQCSSSPESTVLQSTLVTNPNTKHNNNNNNNNKHYLPLLLANFFCLFVGSVSSSLLSKYYFIHKGSSIWVSTWVQSAGFPLLFLPIFLPYHLLNSTQRKPFTRFTPKLVALSVAVGLLIGLNNLLFSWGNSYLPVSTSSLLLSSQLAFTLILSVVIVGQKITFSNLNCVVLLVTSSFLLALGANSDKPAGLTRAKYFLGFASTVGAGLLFALYLPVMERIYRQVYCYAMVVEMQLVMEVAATALATVGMAAGGGFRDMRRESAGRFDRGAGAYWAAVLGNAATWQLCFVGTAGMVFMTTSLTGGICMTALMAVNVLGGVVAYGDHFGGVKAVSTALTVWGFCSYVYGMYVVKMREEIKEGVDDRKDQSNNQVLSGMEMVPMVINDRV